jgi:hypothetical protein
MGRAAVLRHGTGCKIEPVNALGFQQRRYIMFTAKSFAGKSCALVLLGAWLAASIGCGSTSDCGINGLNVTPATTTASHAAAAPANAQVFSASFQFKNNPGCPAITAALVNSNWMVSDPSVHLSASPTTQVTATCTAAVAGPVTITATPVTGEMFTGKASLTCN